jgi:hypothetical protein
MPRAKTTEGIEYILGPAIRFEGVIHFDPECSGHSQVAAKINKARGAEAEAVLRGSEYGFRGTAKEFYSREEAFAVALKAKQVKPGSDSFEWKELMSPDLLPPPKTKKESSARRKSRGR